MYTNIFQDPEILGFKAPVIWGLRVLKKALGLSQVVGY